MARTRRARRSAIPASTRGTIFDNDSHIQYSTHEINRPPEGPMLGMPAVLANTLVPWFAKATRVTSVETLAPRLRRVRFEGESLKGVRAEPGHEVEFRVGPTAIRHDTPSLVDPARGALEVFVFFHGQGPGSSCRHAAPGTARPTRLREARRAQQGLLAGRQAGPLIATCG